jgi:hypothetical protein
VLIWPLIVALVALGGLNLHALKSGYFWPLAATLTLPLILGAALLAGGRRVSILNRAQMASTFSVHFIRSLVQQIAEFGLWWFSGALPSATACLQFVVLQLLITRLPLVPNKNLIFVGAGIAAAGLIKAPAAPIAAVLVIKPAFGLLAAIVVVGVPWLLDRSLFRAEPNAAVS